MGKPIAAGSVSSHFAVRGVWTETRAREADERWTFPAGAEESCLQTELSMKEGIGWDLRAQTSS